MTEQPPPPDQPTSGSHPAQPGPAPSSAPQQPAGQPPTWTSPPQPTQPPQQPPPGYGAPPGAYGPPPTGYAPPAGGYAAPPPQGGQGGPWSGPNSPQAIAQKEASGFFSALFDYSFSRFVTPLIVKFLYVLITVGVAIGYLFYVIVAFEANAGLGLVTLVIIGPIVSIVILAFYRVTLELYLSVVRMSEDIHRMQSGGRQL